MKAFLQVIPMYLILLLAHSIMSYGSYTFIFSKIKSGVYSLPILGEFTSWQWFTITAWLFAAMLYIPGTILVVLASRLSMKNSGSMYPWAIAGQIVPIITMIFFMYYRIGETPNRNGWIALLLVMIASVFAAYSGKN